jgi:hypothetical protein
MKSRWTALTSFDTMRPRQAVIIGATLAAAIAIAQFLDRDPVPTGAVPVLWVATTLLLVVELAGLAPFRRVAHARPVLTAAAIAVVGGVLAMAALADPPRLSAYHSPPPAPVWSRVQSSESRLPLGPAARELHDALQAASNVDDLAACSAFMGPEDSLTTRRQLPVGELISSPRVKVIPRLARLRDALRAMERVPLLRQVNRSPAMSTTEERLVRVYDGLLTRSWLAARGLRRASDDMPPEGPVCVYGFTDLSTRTFLSDFDAALRAIPGM